MASFRSSSIPCFLFLCFVLSSALDMSIITYDQTHNQNRTDAEAMAIYDKWLVHHGGKASNAIGEKGRRFEIFKDNLRFVDEHNAAENRTYRVGLNRFANLSNEEYRSMFLGVRMETKRRLSSPKTSDRYKNAHVVSIEGYEDVPENDEKSLKKAVSYQPVSVAIEAGGRAFQLYESGVFTGLCGTNLDHGVVAVGYGSEDGVDYWLVKNSWGPHWGENGYIKMERNVNTNSGKCGIAQAASYPIKTGPNPPNPGPSPPSPVKPPTVCDDYYSCPGGSTCCCVYEYGGFCFGWGCCPLESATCCADHSSCCPQEFPVCDTDAGTCLLSKDNPVGVKALQRGPANCGRLHVGRIKDSA
ncbi:hypothetical protein TEA_000501 [Camellia sinensis var. sinensis]|uniref:Cysteine protease n=1 Tax=Camellia sinensis var. sinensis TaxID=542762 RepID=A0A4S4DCI1_CAMSN|nr:hypothetical protein TEA_000501 [Camellia sinensis var. sinensis]